MATPSLTPSSQTSTVVLPSTGSYTIASVAANYPYGLYADSSSQLYDANFITGAVEQVTYVFRKLGGDVLDLEITDKNIYSAYEEAVLEYSYIVNIHQSKNVLHLAARAPDQAWLWARGEHQLLLQRHPQRLLLQPRQLILQPRCCTRTPW